MYSNKTLFAIVVLVFSLTSYSFQCRKNIGCAQTIFNFEMGIEARPDDETIHIGDTIWLSIDESTSIKEIISGRIVDYGNAANLGSAIAFQKLSSTNTFSIKAADQFDFLLVAGKETENTDPTLLREYLFLEKDNRYLFRLAVVPKHEGTFRLFFSNAANVFRKNDECTKANFNLNFENTNQHINLYPGPTDSISGGGVYYFKVI